MKRLVPFLLFSVFIASCSDERTPTTPLPTLDPSFEEIETPEDPSAARITLLIKAIEPPPGQLNATEKRWESIQRQMAAGEIDAAQAQMLALADKAVDFYEKGVLLVLAPDDSDLPDSTVEAVAELVMRLFVYVELPSSGAADRYPTFFDSVFDGGDSGFGVLVPDEPTVIVTDNGWAAVAAPAGATDDPVYITLELKEADYCDPETDLIQARGCWEINRVPEGDFNVPVQVEICVDPNTVPEDLEPFILLHKKDEDTGDITALPWADPLTIDCTLFPVEETLAAGAPSAPPSFLGSIGRAVSRLLLPDPLYASFFTGRPPLGIGGLTGSFTDFFGAVPEYEEMTVTLGADSTTLGVAATLEDAMKLILPGGTILMGDGTHTVEDVVVDKPVTLDEVDGATAIIQNDAGQRSLSINGIDVGVVTIRNLDFLNNVPDEAYPGLRTSSIEAKGSYADVIIEDNTFTNGLPDVQSAVRVDTTWVVGAQVLIQNNSFEGGRTGVVATGLVETTDPFVTVAHNDFTGIRGAVVFQTDADGVVFDNDISDGGWHCITFNSSSNGVISENRLTNCGIYGGIRVFGGLVEVADNQITDDEEKPVGWDEATDPYHAAIRFSSDADGSVHGNVIDGCGWGGCIQVSYGATASVFDNEIRAYQGAGTEFGFLTFGGYVPAEANPPTVSITDNTVTGVGFGDGPADRYDQGSYGIIEGALLVRNATVVEFSRNQVDSVNWGIDIYENGTIEAGVDNVVNFAYGAITSSLTGQIEMTHNDFTDWVVSIWDGGGTLNGSVSCNWWGDAFGPSNNDFPPGGSPVVYSPWADGPVANGGGGSCSLATIGGSVLLDGDPLSGVTVTVSGPETAVTASASDGAYQFSNLLPGTYTVTISDYLGEYPETAEVVALTPGSAETVDFNGARLPYFADTGTAGAVSWFMAEPAAAVSLCNGEGLDPCLAPDVADVTLTARATGAAGVFSNPFAGGYVYFYFWDLALGRYRFVDRVDGNSALFTDSGIGPEGRQYNWTVTVSINGEGIPPGPIHVRAVGVDSSHNAYLMPVANTNVSVVDGSIVGEDM